MPKKSKTLVIVESPTKARTLKGILGSEFEVMASMGHIRDLPKSKLGVDVEKGFKPDYVIPTKARKTVTTLKKAASEAGQVILATDEDREGEAIAWHIASILDNEELPRITFHEITAEAILNAIQNPRRISTDLVNAQQARRILDRLVGYELSPLLWKKIFKGLSAGRVQSAALRLLVEREREIQAFKPEAYWRIAATFELSQGATVLAELNSAQGYELPVHTGKEADAIRLLMESESFKIASLTEDDKVYRPQPPFTTSTLQQTASNRLGFSVKKTMMVAQQLYEGIKVGGKSQGLITYMRTDSTNLAGIAINAIRSLIEKDFGKQYLPDKSRFYSRKSKMAQEAHEAIRPTNLSLKPAEIKENLTPDQFKLYDLIWRRAVACQMTDMRVSAKRMDITSDSLNFRATGAQILFDGFARVYPKQVSESTLPAVKEGDAAKLVEPDLEEKFTEPPARFNEASLVKQLEKLGIGRPSTYAPTISTLESRNYIIKEKKQLVPQEVAFLVIGFLEEHFPEIVDYKFTAKMEDELDEIAEGEKETNEVLSEFYKPFAEKIQTKKTTVEKVSPDEELGRKCPECGEGDLMIKHGRFGKFIACSRFPECRYTEKIAKEGEASEEPKETFGKCPECNEGNLVKRKGRYGEFLGCDRYPKCKYIGQLEGESKSKAPEVECPKCGKGKIVQKRTKRGKIFYGCSNYPECKMAVWDTPTGEKCPTCGGMMVQKAKKKHPQCVECGFELKSA